MPIYEYQCGSCGHEMEALQKMSDDALVECPSCHVQSLKKLISAAGFRLSGSGWYETDFKSGKKKNVTESSKNSEKASTSKESSGKASKKPSKSVS
ncbi:Glutamate synthase [NADPH] large chain [hydrothermal vent metagenome]|uniref:Glutamate synthase [NADPH] large chain n=1 Tax=hydrothermal vent metagenome TaxID=652676 RepID=A0A3B0ZWD3_9ZZZZ